ncbi:unnamed protein product, partial [marine sediment metagenome]
IGFSVNKLNGKKGVTIYANYGRGESVVGGNIVADCWVFDEFLGKLIMQRCGTKEKRHIKAKEGGTIEVDTPIDQQTQQTN